MKNSIYFRRAIQEVLDIPYCEQTYHSKGCALFQTPLFYIRVLDNEEVWIQLAERATFDRWGNSTNFEARRCKTRNCYYPKFLPQYKWAIKVLKTNLFDFQRYFDCVHLPWLGHARNRSFKVRKSYFESLRMQEASPCRYTHDTFMSCNYWPCGKAPIPYTS